MQSRTIIALHRIEVEDTVVATIEFSNGAVGTLEATTSVYPGYPRRLELTGSEGTIIVEDDRIVQRTCGIRLQNSHALKRKGFTKAPLLRWSRTWAAIGVSWKILYARLK